LGCAIAHLCAWRAVAELRKDWEAACQAARCLGSDPWPALLASEGLPAPGYLTADNWKDILVGLCDGYFGTLPSAVTAAIDAGAPLSTLVQVGLETGYVAPDSARTGAGVKESTGREQGRRLLRTQARIIRDAAGVGKKGFDAMAKVWPYRDGTVPTEGELWCEIPIKQCKELFSLTPCDYICDLSNRPIFDTIAKPSPKGTVHVDMGARAPVYRNVVVEVGEAEAISCGGDWKPGFYHVRSMTPAEVYETLGLASTSGSSPRSA
jgi:hypothetical protein